MGFQGRPIPGGTPNQIVADSLVQYIGNFAIKEAGPQVAPFGGGGFAVETGGSNNLLADVAYNQSSDLVLVPPCPANLRIKPFGLTLNMHGQTAWAGGTALTVKDTAGATLAYFPLLALQTPFASFDFPTSGSASYPKTAALATPYYDATTGVLTFASSTWITTTLANVPLTVVAGTGIGQTGIIASNTATTITMDQPFATALDSTSVVAVHYYIATAGGATSITASNAAWTSNQFTDGGWSVIIVAGTGAGQVRSITSNTTTALTVPTWTTNPDTTSLFVITRSPELMGAVAPAFNGMWSNSCGKGAGIKVSLLGTFTGTSSSPVRVAVTGYYGN